MALGRRVRQSARRVVMGCVEGLQAASGGIAPALRGGAMSTSARVEVLRALVFVLAVVALAGCSKEEPGSMGDAVTGLAGMGGAAAGAGGASGAATGASGAGGGAVAVAGSGGLGASGSAAGAGGTGAGGAGAASEMNGDAYVSDVNVAVHEDVNTILVVTWTQTMAVEETWLEFSFEDGDVLKSRARPGAAGEHRDVVLGVPGETEVTIRVVSKQGGVEYKTRDYQGTTDAVPSGMPVPMVLSYDAELASPDRYMFGAVEDSDGGCNNQSCFYHTTFWLYIMDRQGRILWYYADPASNATSSFQRIARDGEYIWIEKRPFSGSGNKSVLKMTLDRAYSQTVTVPDLSDAIDVTSDGSLLYDTEPQWELREMNKAGTVRTIWSCRTAFGSNFMCYSNTVNWDPASDSIILSFPYENTVAQIDRKTGTLVATYGARTGSYAFDVANWSFEFQHFANISSRGTLLVSSHLPGNDRTESPVANQHAFEEWTIDRTNKRLMQRWIYSDGPEWAMYKGMVILLPNGNYLANYGTGGVIREITPDKKTVFHVKFDVTTGNDFFNKMVGHNVLINDLYALNGGGPK
jgi:hypothetical protein